MKRPGETRDAGAGQGADAARTYMERWWEMGQEYLGRGMYGAVRGALERAEGLAWRGREWRALARMCLPLLETRRQIRQEAAHGVIVVTGKGGRQVAGGVLGLKGGVERLMRADAGTVLLSARAGGGGVGEAVEWAHEVERQGRRMGRSWEALILLERGGGGGGGGEERAVSAGEARFGVGLWVVRAACDTKQLEMVDPEVGGEMSLPLPKAGVYEGEMAGQVLARESLLVGWEGLALKWQGQHPIRISAARGAKEALEGGVAEMGWLRRALQIDPACEPVMMRLMTLAEGLAQRGGD